MGTDTSTSLPRHRGSARLSIWGVLALGFVALIILDCSGLFFPIFKSGLAKSITTDLGISLPQSAKVIAAERIACRDPAYYYHVTAASADVEPFIKAIAVAAKSRRYGVESIDDQARIALWDKLGLPKPKWWTATAFPDIQRIDVGINGYGYIILYSSSTGEIFVEYYTT